VVLASRVCGTHNTHARSKVLCILSSGVLSSCGQPLLHWLDFLHWLAQKKGAANGGHHWRAALARPCRQGGPLCVNAGCCRCGPHIGDLIVRPTTLNDTRWSPQLLRTARTPSHGHLHRPPPRGQPPCPRLHQSLVPHASQLSGHCSCQLHKQTNTAARLHALDCTHSTALNVRQPSPLLTLLVRGTPLMSHRQICASSLPLSR
jgi:hypothetical protein